MHLIYSKNGSPLDGLVGAYRNPDFFQTCEAGAEKVSVAPEFEAIATAYRKAGVTVDVLGKKKGGKADGTDVG